VTRTPWAVAIALLAAAFAAVAPTANAATYPTGFSERTLVSGLDSPVGVAWTPDGRMLVIEQAGKLKVVAPGGSAATTILNISSRVNSFGDRGLLGLAVDSDFASNRYIYLLYTVDVTPLTADSNGAMVSRLGRFVLNPDNTLGPETVLLGSFGSDECPAPSNTLDCIPSDGDSHSIGSVRSAPDGTLYVSSGDAASYNIVDPLAFRSYDERSLAGKILRIDRDGRGLPGHSFCPADNDLSHVCTKLHAKGFRNPYRMKLAGDGRLTVGDVGWTAIEEIDLIGTAGKSYGWPCYEGSTRRAGYRDRPECPPEYAKEGTANAHVPPDHEYGHTGSNAVVGGPTYDGTAYPAGYQGSIFFGDYAGGFIERLTLDGEGRVNGVQDFSPDLFGAVDLETAPGSGNLVYVQFGTGSPGTGSVNEVMYTAGNTAPTARATATPDAGLAPLTVGFSSAGSHDPDGDTLVYDWDFGDGTTHSTQPNPTHVYDAPGTYTARLRVSDGRGGSATDTVQVTAGNQRPTPTIQAPVNGSSYRDGQTIPLRGTATDPQDGDLSGSALTWSVVLHHGSHVHPLVEIPGTTENPSFVARDDHDADSFYEITLTARDSSGLTGSAASVITPETVTFTLESTPPGTPVTYGGETGTTPYTRQSAIGYRTTVSAANEFARSGRLYRFDSWSDGGARSHDVTIPSTASTLTASYTDIGPDPQLNSLVAAFGFDEVSGSTVVDASGRGSGGTISGASRTAAGKFGGALSFDGVDDWVTVADSASLDLSGAMTLEAWVRPGALSGWRTVLLKETSNHLAYGLYAASGAGGSPPQGVIGESSVDGSQGLLLNTWAHLATTWDGGTWRLFVNGVQVGVRQFSGSIPQSAQPLRIGGNAVWGDEWFQGQIDEVRVYNRALSAAEIAADRDTPVGGGGPPGPDTTVPSVSITAPQGGANVSGSVSVAADAADNVGVAGVQFKLDGANLGSEDTSAPYSVAWDTTSAASGSHTLTAVARDAAGNSGSSQSVVVSVDNTQPSVSITAPASGATVSGSVSVAADASDNVGVAGVQFKLDGTDLGAEDTSAPYSVSWNSTLASNGSHTLTAVARDAAGNTRTSGGVTVTVSNSGPPPPPAGLVAAYGFNEASGTSVTDATGNANTGTMNAGVTRSATGRYGRALSFNGSSGVVTIPDANSLDLTTGLTLSAYVRPTTLADWRTVVLKEMPGGLVYGMYSSTNNNRPAGELSVGQNRPELKGTASLTVNTWQHLALTYDGTTMRLYIDGVLRGSRAQTGSIVTSSGALKIGGNAVWGEWFSGLIDEVRIYNRALNASELTTDMNTPL
jgi:glucose/arabinose dehydrogenase/PKD repeat protein